MSVIGRYDLEPSHSPIRAELLPREGSKKLDTVLFMTVAGLGVLVVRTTSLFADPRGTLYPTAAALRGE